MNFPRIALAAVAAWIVALVVGFVLNDMVLADILAANQSAMRPEADLNANLPIGFVFLLVAFFAFAYAFAKGYEGTNGLMEGVRFGVLIGIVVLGTANIWQWIVYPITGTMAVVTSITSIVEMAMYGAVVGAIYRPLDKPLQRRAAAL
jgi:hypothetical protein